MTTAALTSPVRCILALGVSVQFVHNTQLPVSLFQESLIGSIHSHIFRETLALGFQQNYITSVQSSAMWADSK
jgi:hypothetical protein